MTVKIHIRMHPFGVKLFSGIRNELKFISVNKPSICWGDKSSYAGFSHQSSGEQNQIESERASVTLIQLMQIFSP